MAKPEIPEIDLSAAAFDAANPTLIVEKLNYSQAGALLGTLPPSAAARYPTAELVNLTDNLARRYQRRLSGLVRNVIEFGAVGDGSNDDTAAIQAAIDAGPGVVFFPPGVYIVTLLTRASGVTLRGASAPDTIIRVAGADLVTHIDSNGLRLFPGAGTPDLVSSAGGVVELEIDMSTLATASISSGSVSIGGDVWTASVNVEDTLQSTSGAGIDWEGGASNTRYDTAGQTATSLELPMATLYNRMGIDASWSLRVEAYVSAENLPDNGNAIGIGLRGESGTPSNVANRFAGSSVARQGGVRLWRPVWGASGLNYTTAPAPNANVVGVVGASTSAMKAIAGEWSASWAGTAMNIGANIGANMADDEVVEVNNVLALFFATGSTAESGATGTIERVRVRAVPS